MENKLHKTRYSGIKVRDWSPKRPLEVLNMEELDKLQRFSASDLYSLLEKLFALIIQYDSFSLIGIDDNKNNIALKNKRETFEKVLNLPMEAYKEVQSRKA